MQLGFESRSDQWLVLGFAIVACSFLIYGIFPTIGTTFDSLLYLDAAEKLPTEGLYHKTFDSFPPLFPFILFLLNTNLIAVSIFNIICWLLFQFLILSILVPKVDDRFTKHCLAVTILFGTPLFLVSNFVWAEPSYLVLIALFLWIAHRSANHIGLLAMLLLGAISLKYISLAAVLAFGFIRFQDSGLKESLKLVLPAILAFVVMQVHTFFLRSDLSRLGHSEDLDLVSNIVNVGLEIAHWFYPWKINPVVGFSISIAVLVLLAIKGLKSTGILKYGFALGFAICLIILFKGDLIVDDVERYLAPAYPFFVLLAFSLIRRIPAPLLMRLMLIAVTLYTMLRTIKNCFLWHEMV